MKKITVGFSRPKGNIFPFFSWGIRIFQGWTDYSHVYVKTNSKKLNRDIIYQASGLQVNFIGANYFYEHVHVIKEFVIEIEDSDYLNMMRFMVDNAGKPYSFRDILAISLKSKKLLDGDKGFVCSNLIGTILHKFKGLSSDKNIELLIPKDIYNILIK